MKRTLGAAALIVLALTPSGCGGGDGEGTLAPGVTDHRAEESTPTVPLPVPDEAADRVALKGIDESIASFGHTAKGRESDEIIAPLLAFFAAKASGDYARACGLLESYMYRQLAYAAKQEKPGRLKHKNCSGVMEALLEPISHRFLSQAAQIDVALVKVESNRAYVVYSTPGVSSAIMYMHRESGEWMVGKIDADRLL